MGNKNSGSKPHKNKQAIVSEILKGEKYEWIMSVYDVSHMTIQRYRRHLGIPKYGKFNQVENKAA